MMSGTSLDGVDLCLTKLIDFDDHWEFEILDAKTIGYDEVEGNWKEKLEKAYSTPPEELDEIDSEYASFLGQLAKDFISHHQVKVDFIASHGHTVYHEPENGITYQLGNHPDIARVSGHKVVGDFRSDDVALDGEGAPLVPIGDKFLFGHYEYCLNLGGISNISFDRDGKRIAFDISPCNMLLNEIAMIKGQSFDSDGHMAREGRIIEELLGQWNSLDFYREKGPKSLGREWYEEHFSITQKLKKNWMPQDLARTATEHIAIQVGLVLSHSGQCLTTGGGARNEYLIERIRHYSKAKIVIPESRLVDFKEALIFALLGALRLNGENNVLSSVTGALKDHSSGKIFLPKT